MASLTTSPTLPAPGRKIKVVFSLTESGSNFVRVSVTNAPPGSELRGKLDKARAERIEVFESDGLDFTWEHTFDAGGRYTFFAQEYSLGNAGSAGYQGAPGTEPLETPVGSGSTLTLDIGQRITFPVGTGADTATLVTWVWNDTIRPTTVEHQGEATPDIIAASPSTKIKAAMESTAVRAAVAALPGVTCSAALGDIDTIVAEMVTNINGHNALAANVHNAADAINIIPASYGSASSPATLPGFVSYALKALKQHRQNDDGSGIDSVVIHNPPASSVVADFVNMPIIDAVGGLADAYASLAEIWRCQNGHVPTLVEVFNTWHGPPNTPISYFGLTALPPILEVHRRIFDVLASFNSTTPPTQTTGAMLLIEGAGGVEG